MFDEAHQPRLADLVEKGLDVAIEHPVDAPPADPERERIQRLVLIALRSEPVAEPQELPPHRSASGLPPPPPGRSCPPGQRCRAAAACHPASQYKSDAMAALDTLLFGRENGDPRGSPRGLSRTRSMSSRRRRARRTSSARRSSPAKHRRGDDARAPLACPVCS